MIKKFKKHLETKNLSRRLCRELIRLEKFGNSTKILLENEYKLLLKISNESIDSRSYIVDIAASDGITMSPVFPFFKKGSSGFAVEFNSEKFDLMIDDGLHEFEAGRTLFENSYQELRDGGIYIIEDILMSDKQRYREYFDASEFDSYFIDLLRPNVNLLDNSLIMISKNANQTSR